MDWWTDENRAAFLAALADGNSVAYAAKKGAIGRSTVYEFRKANPDFAAKWDAAVETGTDGLEDEAMRRAKTGSDVLLIFMLKARRKPVYAELNRTWITGKDDKPIQTENVTPDERPAVATFLEEFSGKPAEETKH